jgi:hypothetical protein
LFCNDKVEVIIGVCSDVFDVSVVAQIVLVRDSVDSIVSVFVESDMVIFQDTELFLVFTGDTIVVSSDIENLFFGFDMEKMSL